MTTIAVSRAAVVRSTHLHWSAMARSSGPASRLRLVSSFRELPPPRRRVVLLAGGLLILTRASLRFLPVATVRSWLDRAARTFGQALVDPDAVRWLPQAVTTAGRHVPGGRHCLAKAMVARALLGAVGLPVELRAGVRRGPDGRMQGHAWLEREGSVVMDAGEDTASFARLVALEGALDDLR